MYFTKVVLLTLVIVIILVLSILFFKSKNLKTMKFSLLIAFPILIHFLKKQLNHCKVSKIKVTYTYINNETRIMSLVFQIYLIIFILALLVVFKY